MTGPLVSVVIPCYNVVRYVQEAINSIINQTYTRLEILIIDDGSTDGTSKILDEIVKKEGRARLIRHERNLGIVATLNHAIDECKGEYMAYMHADDISAVTRIEHFIQFLNRYPDTDLIAARYAWMNENGKVSCSVKAKATLPKSIKFAVFFITPMPHPLLMGKPELFRKYRYDLEYEYSEDYDLISRIALSNMTLRNIDESLYFIRLNDQRLSYKYEDRQDKNHIKVSFRNIADYFGIRPDPVIHQIVANRIQGSVSPSQVIKAFRLINSLNNHFQKTENCSTMEVREIQKVVTEQKIDILIQSFKRGHFPKKLNLLILLPIILTILIKKESLEYILEKIRTKFLFRDNR